MQIKTLKEMFVHTLADIHYAENKILKALPKLIKASENAELKAALEGHKIETEGQIERIIQVFGLMKQKPTSAKCKAIEGILEEGEEMLGDTKGTPMSDLGVISSGQAVEHYEMVRYRSLVMWAGVLGMDEAAKLLQQSLNEETLADEKLMAFGAYVQGDTVDNIKSDVDHQPAPAGSVKVA
jgi:ferritin-like metal-binding protein YciE